MPRAIGSPSDVDAKARNNVTALVQRQAGGVVPAGTRQIIVTVQFLSGMESTATPSPTTSA